jgi:cell wall-associated NlpC family hydrolase
MMRRTAGPATAGGRALLGGAAAMLVLSAGAVADHAGAAQAAMPPLPGGAGAATAAAVAAVSVAEAQSLAQQQARIDAVVALARAQLGDRYVYGAAGPDTFDCSGFTMWTYRQAAGVSLPHHTGGQWNSVERWSVGERDPQPGDLVFFFNGADHVGLYLGDGQMIHAANPRTGVTIDPVSSGYWGSRLTGFGRVLP